MTADNQLPCVLVADDEGPLRLIIAETLQDAGFHVLEAGSGDEALARLEECKQVCLLISDVRMPGLDGYKLSQMLHKQRPEFPIILMTGYAEEPPAELLNIPAVTFLYKPFDIDVLIERARTAASHVPA